MIFATKVKPIWWSVWRCEACSVFNQYQSQSTTKIHQKALFINLMIYMIFKCCGLSRPPIASHHQLLKPIDLLVINACLSPLCPMVGHVNRWLLVLYDPLPSIFMIVVIVWSTRCPLFVVMPYLFMSTQHISWISCIWYIIHHSCLSHLYGQTCIICHTFLR